MVVIASSLYFFITHSPTKLDYLSVHLAQNACLKAPLSNLVSSISTDKVKGVFIHSHFSTSNISKVRVLTVEVVPTFLPEVDPQWILMLDKLFWPIWGLAFQDGGH
jgi:hypothetical protein